MIKTRGGMTTATGTKEELLTDFAGTAESLLRRTNITAEELYETVKIAEKTVELITSIGEYFGAFDKLAEAEAEEKPNAKKGAVKATTLEADDLKGMMEWLKGELENLEEQCDD